MDVLVAGVGQVLRGDDGFGVEVARRLATLDLGKSVRVIETGTGGINLVTALYDPTDVLIVLDAVDHGRPPGTVMVIEPEVADVDDLPQLARWDFLADMHYTKPESAFMLAKALGVLPERFLLVGCQPQETETLEVGLSPAVARAVEVAIAEVRRLLDQLLQGNS
ncbi:MAG TPA: hydrogenase maturation protease [Egibacteraceae bacterium]|jgi:hydrogenase maturation protease|nr:hydrogenase maturation protease [Egibacteraceae bacterium]